MVEVRGHVKRPPRALDRFGLLLNCNISYGSLDRARVDLLEGLHDYARFRGLKPMSAGQNAKNGQLPPDDVALLGGSGLPTLTLISPADRLDYIADIVHELKIMAAQADCQALAGLLEVAYLEARRQRLARA